MFTEESFKEMDQSARFNHSTPHENIFNYIKIVGLLYNREPSEIIQMYFIFTDLIALYEVTY